MMTTPRSILLAALVLFPWASAFIVQRVPRSHQARTAEQKLKQHTVLFSSAAFVGDLTREMENGIKDCHEHLRPPSFLDELEVGESYSPFEPLQIRKVSNDPPIFVIRNFLPLHHCQTLMEATEDRLRAAKTVTGSAQHRVGSSLAWIHPGDDKEHERIAAIMTKLSVHLFRNCDNDDVSSNQHIQNAEPLQVVRYDQSGSFDLHTDGCDRVATVLTYMNGVAGTWFPFVGASDDEVKAMKQRNHADLENRVIGRDGLLICGEEQPLSLEEESSSKHESVVRVSAGDAVVFYNYEPDALGGNKVEAWRSLHCGLKALDTKWIATNWLR